MSKDLYIVAQSLDNSNVDDIWKNGEYKKSDGQSKNHEEEKRIMGGIFTEMRSNIGSYKSGVRWIITPNILYVEILSENPDNCGRLSPIYIEAKTADKNALIESLKEFSKKSNRGVFHAAEIKNLIEARNQRGGLSKLSWKLSPTKETQGNLKIAAGLKIPIYTDVNVTLDKLSKTESELTINFDIEFWK
jgi:hypothetical protein